MIGWCCCDKRFVRLENKCSACGKSRSSSTILYYRITHKYRTVMRSTRTTIITEAQVAEAKERLNLEQLRPKRNGKTVEDICELRVDLARRSGGKTGRGGKIDGVQRLLSHVSRIMGAQTAAVETADPEAIRAYVERRIGEGVGGQTIRRELQTLRSALRLARIPVPLDWPDARNMPELRRKETERSESARGHVIPMAQAVAFLDALRTVSAPAYELALVALLTGLRATELQRLERSWLQQAPAGSATEWVLAIPAASAKDRDARIVGAPQQVVDIIRKSGADRIFPVVAYPGPFARAGAIARVRPPTLRDWRKTHATIAAWSDVGVHAVSQALGHSSLTTTSLYLGDWAAGGACVAASVAKVLGAASLRA